MERYLTRGVQAEIDLQLAMLLFDVQAAIPIKKDYLCVFELEPVGDGTVEVTVRQEIPSYESKSLIKSTVERYYKLFLIDHVLMLAFSTVKKDINLFRDLYYNKNNK